MSELIGSNKLEENKLLEIIQQNSLWLKITAVMLMLNGVLISLSIVGALIGIPLVWVGWSLFSSVGLAADGKGEDAIKKICLYFKAMGIMLIVGVVFMLLQMLFFGAMLGGAF